MSLAPLAAIPLVIDTSTKLTSSEARSLYAAGVRAVGRYVFFGSPRPGDIDGPELGALTDAGLAVFLIQHVRNPGWAGSAAMGAADAQSAIANAIRAGYGPDPRLCLALDLEGIGHGGPEHAAAWCSVVAGQYQPLVYVGYASGMTTGTLDSLAGDPVFWCDYAALASRPHPSKGYALHQQAQSTIAGVGVDVDIILAPGLVGLGMAEEVDAGDPAAGSAQDGAS